MKSVLRLALLLLMSPLGLYLCQAGMSRLLRIFRVIVVPQLVAFGIVIAGNLPMLWLARMVALNDLCRTSPEMFWGYCYVLLAYNSFGFCYFNVLNASETSLHVHILTTLRFEGSMRVEDLAARYSTKNMIDARIERMIGLGQLKEKDGYFVLTGSAILLTVGKLLKMWRRVLGLTSVPNSRDEGAPKGLVPSETRSK